jgi:SAM (Sterile alpha motif) domain-containing protein
LSGDSPVMNETLSTVDEPIMDFNIVEENIRHWDHVETARQLQNLGVEEKHCDIFEQQEITGDILLEMDQGFIFMKEFDFGVMGRRFKTWHMIKAFQEVKGFKPPNQTAGIKRKGKNTFNLCSKRTTS